MWTSPHQVPQAAPPELAAHSWAVCRACCSLGPRGSQDSLQGEETQFIWHNQCCLCRKTTIKGPFIKANQGPGAV